VHQDTYAELVFLHLVGPTGHVVHSVVSGTQNVIAQFFIFGLDRYIFHKKSVGTHYAKILFLHPVRSLGHVVHCGASGA
jgi:hypothetical protein